MSPGCPVIDSLDPFPRQCLLGDKEDVINQKSRCCSISSDFDPLSTNNNSMPCPPGPPKSHPPRTATAMDMERMSEKYWGEILERTLSSTSLHALQQSFSGQRTPLAHHQNRFNHSPSMLTTRTSLLSLNHISRDNGLDQFRQHHYRHSFLNNSNNNGDLVKHLNGDGDEEEDDEDEEEEEEENGDLEEEEEDEEEGETSNSDSAQETRGRNSGGGPRVSFLSNSETRLTDFSIHDKNCAKAKAFNAQIESVKGLPGI